MLAGRTARAGCKDIPSTPHRLDNYNRGNYNKGNYNRGNYNRGNYNCNNKFLGSCNNPLLDSCSRSQSTLCIMLPPLCVQEGLLLCVQLESPLCDLLECIHCARNQLLLQALLMVEVEQWVATREELEWLHCLLIRNQLQSHPDFYEGSSLRTNRNPKTT